MIALLPVGVLGARNPRNLLMDNRVASHSGTNEAFLNIFFMKYPLGDLTKREIRARLVISF
jgi:hypothetical protein